MKKKHISLAFSAALALTTNAAHARGISNPQPLPTGDVMATSDHISYLDNMMEARAGALARLKASLSRPNLRPQRHTQKTLSFARMEKDQKKDAAACNSSWGQLEATANLPGKAGEQARSAILQLRDITHACKDTWKPMPFTTGNDVFAGYVQVVIVNNLVWGNLPQSLRDNYYTLYTQTKSMIVGDSIYFCQRDYDRLVATVERGDPKLRYMASNLLNKVSPGACGGPI